MLHASRRSLSVAAGIAAWALAWSAFGHPTAPGVPRASGTVIFAGDVVPHGVVMSSVDVHGPASLFGPIAPIVRAADVALVNLESPAAPSLPLRWRGPPFNVGRTFIAALAAAGFDGVSVANNHSYDAGSAAIGETMRTLRAAGLVPVGAALPGHDLLAPAEFRVAGRMLCVFAATRLINLGPEGIGPQPRIVLARPGRAREQALLLAAIRAHAARCGAVLVSVHAGREFQDVPDPDDVQFFHQLADAGADVVVGTHSHTPQPVELYAAGARRVPIFYSLGNAVSNQGTHADANSDPWAGGRWHRSLDPRVREGLLAVVRFDAGEGPRLRAAAFGYVPLWTVSDRRRVAHGGTARLSAALMPDGGGDPGLARRWASLVSHVGAQFLLPVAAVPGAAEAHLCGDAAVLASRRGWPLRR